MILAAGEGRRLRPLTETTPKALVDVAGAPLIEHVARNLIEAGADRLIVNAHYLADRVEAWGKQQTLGVPVVIAREDDVAPAPLETGGALRYAEPLFEKTGPFLLHNADIVTQLDLGAVFAAHVAGAERDGRLATLVVKRRETTRPLMVDAAGVYGRANRTEGWEVIARPPLPDGDPHEVGFSGIHVLSETIFDRLEEEGAFSIIDAYVRLLQEGETIGVFDATDVPWYDIGTPERLERARAAIAGNGKAGDAT